MGKSYSVQVLNNSAQQGTVCLYQTTGDAPGMLPLAWLTENVSPQSAATFRWTTDYSFVWAGTGPLAPGLLFRAAQSVPAEPGLMITLTNRGGYSFGQPQQGSPGLTIMQDGSVQPGRVAVGVAMSGSAVVAAGAQPNTSVMFQPEPHYWIAFGQYQSGQVLNPSTMRGTSLDFGGGSALRAEFQASGQWMITPA